MTRLIGFAILALLLVGCKRDAAPVAQRGSAPDSLEQPAAEPPKIAPPTMAKGIEPPKSEPPKATPPPKTEVKEVPIARDKAEATKKEIEARAKAARDMKVPTVNDQGYKPSKFDPLTVARDADAAIGALVDVTARTALVFKNSEGGGDSATRTVFSKSGKYYLEYVGFTGDKPEIRMAKSDGATKSELKGGWTPPISAMERQAIPEGRSLAEAWPKEFPRLVLSPVIDRQPIFLKYLSAVKADPANYTVSTEERLTTYLGEQWRNYRVTVRRTPSAAATHGAMEVDLVFDSRFKLPVTIRSMLRDKAGAATDIFWSTSYRKEPVTDAKLFEVPKA